ncbi:MAG: ACT domain-containing protein [Candidatus Omnitrophica bacterium]|nr:ACT domain-containing protein [Candidatus Omnitrophota bacterium]MDD5653703.1 ACT domain-containing protein [Candidatus Omnitrophota bacterium]
MIKSASLSKEINVTIVNKIGVLADISKLIAEHGINIEAIVGYAENDNAVIMLVTQDNLRASDALKKSGYKSLRESEVIVVELENKAGALKYLTAKLAAGEIDIKSIYGTTCVGGCAARMVLTTSDNAKALVALKK